MDKKLDVIQKAEFRTPLNKDEFIRVLSKQIDRLDSNRKMMVGIAVCALLSVGGKKLLVAPNLGWKDIVLKDFFAPLKREYLVINDGTAVGWASYMTESDEEVVRFLTVILGTEVGGGIIIDSNLLLGVRRSRSYEGRYGRARM